MTQPADRGFCEKRLPRLRFRLSSVRVATRPFALSRAMDARWTIDTWHPRNSPHQSFDATARSGTVPNAVGHPSKDSGIPPAPGVGLQLCVLNREPSADSKRRPQSSPRQKTVDAPAIRLEFDKRSTVSSIRVY